MSSVRGLFLGGKCAIFEDCKTVGDIMLRVALSQSRLASDVVVLPTGSSQVLAHDAAAPQDVSVMLKNEDEELDEEEWKINVILYAQIEDAVTVTRATAMLEDVSRDKNFWWPKCAEDVLLEAARHKERDKVLRTLVTAGINGGKVLAHFANFGDAAAVQSLISIGVDVNYAEKFGRRALELASEGGHEEVVRLLINARAEVDYEGSVYSLLYPARDKGYKEIVQVLLDTRTTLDNCLKKYGALHMVFNQNSRDMLKIMIDAGAEIPDLNKHVQHYFTEASWRGEKEIVQMLLDERVFLCYRCGRCPLVEASQAGRVSLVQMLADRNLVLQDSNLVDAMRVACREGHADVVEVLIDSQADVNDSCTDSTSQGSLCDIRQREETGQLLTSASARTDYFLKSSLDVLKIATSNRHAEVVRALVYAQVNVNCVDEKGQTALMIAAQLSKEIVHILVDAQADVHRVDNAGLTALCWASKSGETEIVEFLSNARGIAFGEHA